MVDEAWRYPRLRGDSGDRRTSVTMRSKDTREGLGEVCSTLFSHTGSTHRLVVHPIYGPHHRGMSSLRFDDEGFGTAARRIPWEELVAVGIRTTADGPLSDDVFWQFLLPDGLLELPGSMLGDLDSLEKHLPGLDFGKVIKAMGSCGERIFRVWHHEESRDRPGEADLRTRFVGLVTRLGARHDGNDMFARIYAAYSGNSRHYHNVEHLADCLREVDRLPATCSRDLVELALWYHDAVYDAGAPGSEHRSAEWLATDAEALGFGEGLARSAAALVEATVHRAGPSASDEAALVADIDLSVLGRDELRFMYFEYGIGEEFRAMRTTLFLLGRGRFLAGVLENPIYRTASFRDRFEVKARANISALLQSDRYTAYRWLRWLPW